MVCGAAFIIPSHAGHEFAQRSVTGKYFKDVDRWIDEPYRVLKANHRVARHTPFEAMANWYGDTDRVNAALVHLIVDAKGSEDPRFKAILDTGGLAMRAQAKLAKVKSEIAWYRSRGKIPPKKLAEQASIEKEVQLASMALALAMM